jgi:hypothetical protein
MTLRWLSNDDRRALREAAEERRVLREIEQRHAPTEDCGGWRARLAVLTGDVGRGHVITGSD